MHHFIIFQAYDVISQYYYYEDEDIEEVDEAPEEENNIVQATPKVEKTKEITVQNSLDTTREFFMSINDPVKTKKNNRLEQRMEISMGVKVTHGLSFMEKSIGVGNYTQEFNLFFPLNTYLILLIIMIF